MEWISVDTELPEDDSDVWVYLDKPLKHGRRQARSFYVEGEWQTIDGAYWPGMPEVTHWMPLPNPPKE